MKIPSKEELEKLYPLIDVDYLMNFINRQLFLIGMEDSLIKILKSILTKRKKSIILDIYSFANRHKIEKINDKGYLKQEFANIVKSNLDKLNTELIEFYADALLQSYISSLDTYYLMFDNEVAGEQAKERKVNIGRAKAIMEKSEARKTKQILSDLNNEIDKLYNKWIYSEKGTSIYNAINQVDELLDLVSSKIEDTSKASIQQVVYDAIDDIELNIDEKYKLVYQRVEVIDSSVCLLCYFYNGEIIDKPYMQVHKGCRGIDVPLLFEEKSGKYFDLNHLDYGRTIKTKSFEDRFEKLSNSEQQRMLGKKSYELYKNGELEINDFIDYGRKITYQEAQAKADVKNSSVKFHSVEDVQSILKSTEDKLPPLKKMSVKELNEYQKILGFQKQLYDLVPKDRFKKVSKQSYIDNIDEKVRKIQEERRLRNIGKV